MHWLADKIIDLVDALPNWFITEDSPHEMPVRMAIFLILLTLVNRSGGDGLCRHARRGVHYQRRALGLVCWRFAVTCLRGLPSLSTCGRRRCKIAA
jgi:hypothetical protein